MAGFFDDLFGGLVDYGSDWLGNLGSTVGGALQPQSLIPAYLADKTNKRQMDLVEQGMQDAKDFGDPFHPYRAQAASTLNNLYQNPEEYQPMDPGYNFRFDEGQRALERKGASGGMFQSGNMGAALVEYGTGQAQQGFQGDFDNLARMAGVDTNLGAVAGALTGGASALVDLTGGQGASLGNMFSNFSDPSSPGTGDGGGDGDGTGTGSGPGTGTTGTGTGGTGGSGTGTGTGDQAGVGEPSTGDDVLGSNNTTSIDPFEGPLPSTSTDDPYSSYWENFDWSTSPGNTEGPLPQDPNQPVDTDGGIYDQSGDLYIEMDDGSLVYNPDYDILTQSGNAGPQPSGGSSTSGGGAAGGSATDQTYVDFGLPGEINVNPSTRDYEDDTFWSDLLGEGVQGGLDAMFEGWLNGEFSSQVGQNLASGAASSTASGSFGSGFTSGATGAIYGAVGSEIGNALGEELFGKEAESDIGSTAGAAIGTAILPGLGTLAGALVGGLVDVLGGGDGLKRVTLGVGTGTTLAEHHYVTETVTTDSGLTLSALDRYAGGSDTSEEMLDYFVEVDSTLTTITEDLGYEVDLTDQSLSGSSYEDEPGGRYDWDNFYGSVNYNSVSGDQIADAGGNFVESWTETVATNNSPGLGNAVSNINEDLSGDAYLEEYVDVLTNWDDTAETQELANMAVEAQAEKVLYLAAGDWRRYGRTSSRR